MPGKLRLDATLESMRFDIRKPPREGIAQSAWQQIKDTPAFSTPTYKVCIISKAFPWPIIIRAPAGSVVTCGTIFEELHRRLQAHITDAEWAIVAVDSVRKKAIEKAAKSRREKDKDRRLKRIDWLGDTPVFQGLVQDEGFKKQIHLPGNEIVEDTETETWVARFGKL